MRRETPSSAMAGTAASLCPGRSDAVRLRLPRVARGLREAFAASVVFLPRLARRRVAGPYCGVHVAVQPLRTRVLPLPGPRRGQSRSLVPWQSDRSDRAETLHVRECQNDVPKVPRISTFARFLRQVRPPQDFMPRVFAGRGACLQVPFQTATEKTVQNSQRLALSAPRVGSFADCDKSRRYRRPARAVEERVGCLSCPFVLPCHDGMWETTWTRQRLRLLR